MADFKVDLRDIKFVLYEQLEVQKMLGRAPYEEFDKETMDMMIEAAEEFTSSILAPINGPADAIGVKFEDGQVITPPGMKEAFEQYAESGWIALTAAPEFEGQGAPHILDTVANEMFEAGCLSFNLTRMLTHGAANLIHSFGTQEQKDLYLRKMYSGQWAGTMCLTEAGAGTDVGSVRTTATPEGDRYLIEGEKIFITSGDHDLTENIIHAVLARTPGSPVGTKGISLFVVPKFHVEADGSMGEFNHVACERIEEKMGIHGSPTCVLNFGQNGPCYGYLLGEEHAGMREMFQMMNEARLAVGIEGAALGNAAYQHALSFCEERIQGRDITRRQKGGVSINAHPDVRMMLLWQKAHAEGVRALGYYTMACLDRERIAKAAGNEEEVAKWNGMVEILTPIVKAYCTDVGFKVADRAVQCHGGYGYCKEYPAEQFMRDARISMIYEGTNGVQALDLVARKLRQRGGADAQGLLVVLGEMAASIKGPGLGGVAAHVAKGIEVLGGTALGFAGMGKTDPLGPIVNAYGFLELAGDVVVGALLGHQAGIAAKALGKLAVENSIDVDPKALYAFANQNDEAKFYWGKIMSARFFAERVLALVPAKANVLLGSDRSAMEIVF
ncbi:MAG: acyl-CoA dehydrogenase [Proteobacteria bacterium]|nr:acyl-CoA dehydrogenase [Pseudomonadota bacterium]